jgi:hypothetical protein
MPMKRLLIPLLSLTILGAGCAAAPATPAPEPAPTPTTETPSAYEPQPDLSDITEDGEEPKELTPATTDATWRTYTNAALDFSFMWPTKGRYAPEWEVRVFAATDTEVADGGCYHVQGANQDTERFAKVGSQEFCHTSASEGAAGSVYFTDAYATRIGSRVVVILFSKQVTNGGMIPNCSEPYSSVSTACVPFVVTEYQAALEGIVGTFKLTE